MKHLHSIWKHEVQFLDVLTRQAHPGPDATAYQSFEQKFNDAQRYQAEDSIPWPVLVDDLSGVTHQMYGGLADPSYLIDSDGRVAFYNMWTHAPTLHRALTKLMEQGGRGIVENGIDNRPHVLPAMTKGWRGIERGWPQSYVELEKAAPTMATATWLGYQMSPLLGPVTLRARPLPLGAKMSLMIGAGVAAVLWMSSSKPRRKTTRK